MAEKFLVLDDKPLMPPTVEGAPGRVGCDVTAAGEIPDES